MPRTPKRKPASAILSRIATLDSISSSPARVCRAYLSAQHKAAAGLIVEWMLEAGLSAEIDAAGTVVGRVESETQGAKSLLLGGDIGTAPTSGRSTGALGVLIAIAALQEIKDTGRHLPIAVEVLAFGDLDGTRFGPAMFGSHALAGDLQPALLDARDGEGVTLRQALEAFGCDSNLIAGLARDTGGILGYVEVTAEHGPMLEHEHLPLGIVTAISGISRCDVTVSGVAGHAGTMAMEGRRDALAGAAEMVLAVEEVARATPGLVATVGQVRVDPGLANVVAGETQFTIDIRSPVDRTRRTAVRQIERVLKGVARRRRIEVQIEEICDNRSVNCDHRYIRHLSQAVERAGLTSFMLPSGAEHHGLAMANLCPIGVMFVRSGTTSGGDGAEAVSAPDIDAAVAVLVDLLQTVSENGRTIT